MKYVYIGVSVIAVAFATFFIHLKYSETSIMSKIPRTIWQTYKTKEIPLDAKKPQRSWLKKNLGYSYNFWDDNDIENYILKEWDPDTYAFFKDLRVGAMKADLWRYLIISRKGGIYSDIDSYCCQPIKNWAHFKKYLAKDVLLLGIESQRDFSQWTIAASPNHPAMIHVCKYIINKWKQHGINYNDPWVVHETTGPRLWTEALLDYMGLPQDSDLYQIYHSYSYDENLLKRKLHDLGIFLFCEQFYNGIATSHLCGSANFENYGSWRKELKQILKENNVKDELPFDSHEE